MVLLLRSSSISDYLACPLASPAVCAKTSAQPVSVVQAPVPPAHQLLTRQALCKVISLIGPGRN